MTDRQKRFIDLLRTIFELDKSDLDFGIYRILNIRSAEIEKFFTDELPKKITETLEPFAQGDTSELKAEMKKIEKDAVDFGTTIEAMPDTNPKKHRWNEIRQQLAQGTDLSALESDVYSALYSFFNRYYDEGDFISKRRYKKGVYAIPYEGEEVKLYWANQDQYYIKTSENFKNYTFIADGVTVHFRIVDATTEQNNNKEADDKRRQFMLFTPDEEKHPGLETFSYDSEHKELIIRFVYDIPADTKKKTEKWTEENFKAISQYILDKHPELMPILLKDVSAKHDGSLLLLHKHLKGYVAKNTFDYFIHKDLGSFLTQELDFYIKNEIMHLDDLDTENEVRVNTYLAKVRAIKRVGKIIIAFLAQLENFQKKLWLKKKFVVETNWCITLDHINEDLYPEILANEAQMQEWIDMYAIDEMTGDGIFAHAFTNPPSIDFLKDNQYLPVDTKHFNEQFKQKLVASIDTIDEKTSGLMIQSDNFQALRLMSERYRKTIKLVYTDPPYNTDATKILYKNGYEHSSWLSLIYSRLEELKKLLFERSIIEFAIDDYEFRYLNTCLDQVFGRENAISNIAIYTNPKGRDQGFIAQAHDYSIVYAMNKNLAETNNFVLSQEELLKKFSKGDGDNSYRELPLKRTGSGKFREDRPYMYFPFFYSEAEDKLIVIPFDEYTNIYDETADSFNDDYLDNLIQQYKNNGYIAILPLSSKGEKFRWRWGYNSCVKGVEAGVLFCKKTKSGYVVYQYDFADEEVTPKSFWFGERYDASSKGTNLLENIIPRNPFDYPKSLYTVEDNIIIGSNDNDIVLDFFAGSATTGHAVIDLNRNSESSNRKYILVDMGDHFDSVMIPRIKKIIYSPDWKNGKPTARNKGVSQIVKYMRLESYEDALNNIELKRQGPASLFGDDYLLHYMLDLEARGCLLNLDAFKNPFDYKLRITEKNATHKRVIDVVESFNYLIGLTVINEGAVNYFRAEDASKPDYDGAVDLVRDANGDYAFRLIEGKLPNGQSALVIWRTIGSDIVRANAALDAYFRKYRINPRETSEYDVIYVNGDNNLENLRTDEEHWKVIRTETAFNDKMWEE